MAGPLFISFSQLESMHPMATLSILSLDILIGTWPSHQSLLFLISRDVFHAVCLRIQFLISHLVGPSQWILQICRWQLFYERHLPFSYLLSLLSSTQNHTKRKTKCLNSDIRIINPNKFSKGMKKIMKC